MTEVPTFDQGESWAFNEHGFLIFVNPRTPSLFPGMEAGISAAQIIEVTPSDGTPWTEPEHVTHNLLHLLVGLQAFFGEMDNNQKKHRPQELVLITMDERTARMFEQRLGFEVTQSGDERLNCRAKTATVRTKLDKILTTRDRNGRTVVEKLQRRLHPRT